MTRQNKARIGTGAFFGAVLAGSVAATAAANDQENSAASNATVQTADPPGAQAELTLPRC